MSLFYNKQDEVKGKTVLITGGTKNLGGETAKELARFGTNLFLHYHSAGDKQKSEQLANEIQSEHSVKVELYQSALDSAADLEKLFAAAKKAYPQGVDIAINNIGMVLKKQITEVGEEEWEKMDSINNKTAFFFIKEAGKHVKDNGKIISLVTSLLAAYTTDYGVYQGTKAPVEYYSKTASKELQSRGISVNCVAPGPMDTPFLYGQETKESVEFFKTCGLHNRLTKLEDIVPIVRFLATEGGWITGQTIYCSGGFTAH